jgi:hypothetical protein
MNHKEQHHQKHEKEREHDKKEHKKHEQQQDKNPFPFHPAWLDPLLRHPASQE